MIPRLVHNQHRLQTTNANFLVALVSWLCIFSYAQRMHQSGCMTLVAQVGTGYFDAVATVISSGTSSTLAWKESTEASQFH